MLQAWGLEGLGLGPAELNTVSGTDMAGQAGGQHNGNEWRKYRVAPRTHPLRPSLCFLLVIIGPEAKGFLDFQGRHGVTSAVRWNLRLVIFGVGQ